MKAWKYIAGTLAMVVCLSVTSIAQHRGMHMEPEKLAERQTEHMKDALALSDEQVKQVEQANLDHVKMVKEVRDEFHKQRKTTMEAMRAEREKVLESILTEEQLTQWKEIQDERMEKMKKRFRKGPKDCENSSRDKDSLED